MLFAFAIASAGVRKVSTDSTGPKISSRAIVDEVDDVVEDRRGEPEPVLGDHARRRPALGALRLADVAELADAIQLLARVDRADVGVLVERVAEAQRREPLLEPVDDLVVDVLLHQQARPGAADVALVEEDAVDDALDGLVDRRVVEDDVRGLAAELERDLLAGAGDRPWRSRGRRRSIR